MKKNLRTSDPWATSCLSHQPSKLAYCIVDCRIFGKSKEKKRLKMSCNFFLLMGKEKGFPKYIVCSINLCLTV